MVINKLPQLLKSNLIKFNSIIYEMELKDIKLKPVLTDCVVNQYKYLIVIAENEFANGQIVIKDLENKTQSVINL